MNLAITGTGAVSPAGWGVPALMAALSAGTPLAQCFIERPLGSSLVRTPVLRVPPPESPPSRFPRLRRTSPISKFAAAAVTEALGEERLTAIAAGDLRVGVIFTLINGCVNYSNRFFGEVLADPTLASPILFPETVFNAPSSHISAMIGSREPNDSLIADGTGIFSGIDLAAEWLLRGDLDGCIVVASEEIDWLSAEGLRLYSTSHLPSEGASALYLEPAPGPVSLIHLPDPVPFSSSTRTAAARTVREILPDLDDGLTLLVDGCSGTPSADLPETLAWADWAGPRWSPRRILGESMGAAAGLQWVAAIHALSSGLHPRALITATGGNQQAAGALICATR